MKATTILAATLLALPTAAQLKPGTFLATTNGAVADRAVFEVDRFANTANRMVIQGIPWNGVGPMRTFIEDDKNFLLGVLSNGGWIYRVSWSGSAWQATMPLNSTVMGSGLVLWDLTRIGNSIYAVTSSGGSTASDGVLWQLPAVGGTPVQLVNLGPNIAGMPSAMVAVGTVLHIFMWDAPRRGAHVTVDTATTTPTPQVLGQPLPNSLPYAPCQALALLPRQACLDPVTGLLVIVGRTGDVLYRTTGGVDVIRDSFRSPYPCAAPRADWGNALAINTDTGAILVGDADRGLEERVCRTGPWRNDVQFLPVAAGTPINGLTYFASGVLYQELPTSTGCRQGNGQFPIHYVNSLPAAGNTGFAITVQTPSKLGWLVLGVNQTRIDLTPFGAPGCFFGASLNVGVPGVSTSTGLQVPVPLPVPLPRGIQLYTQWLLADPVIPFGLVTSDTRWFKT